MRVRIRGKVYETVEDAAKACGVAKDTVYCAVVRRTTDTIGLGRGNRTKRRGGKPKKPITLGGVTFESMSEASRALGFGRRYVQQVITKGGKRAKENLYRAALEYRNGIDGNAKKGKA